MDKARLRKEMLQKRLAYDAAEIALRSQQIADNFFRYFDLKDVRAIHLFLPIALRNEINTWLIIRKLQAEYSHIKIVVPVTHMQEVTLTHHWLLPKTQLVQNKWGIPEPQGAAAVAVEKLDMVLVPLLAFDSKGNRVGYGKGFYDRFLEMCRPDTIKIGLSLEEPIKVIADVHEGDTALDFVLTPSSFYKFIN